eukprot:9481196-Pyramimonas_sp.AAC.1
MEWMPCAGGAPPWPGYHMGWKSAGYAAFIGIGTPGAGRASCVLVLLLPNAPAAAPPPAPPPRASSVTLRAPAPGSGLPFASTFPALMSALSFLHSFLKWLGFPQ